MQRRKLTESFISRLKPAPPGKRYEVHDVRLDGFSVRVTDSGAKSYCVHCWAGGKHRRYTLPIPVGSKPISEVLTEAEQAKQLMLAGVDPRAARKAEDSALVDTAIELFLERHVRVKNRASTARETERKLRRYVLPAWTGRRLDEIEALDVAQLLKSVQDRAERGKGAVMASRVAAALSKLFNWARLQPEYIQTLRGNPVVPGMAGSPSKPRERYLSREELAGFWRSASSIPYPYGPFFRLLLLCGQRCGETSAMRWSDIDFASSVWRLSGAQTKAGRPHEVPLSSTAVEILESLPHHEGEYVFSTTFGAKPINGMSKAKSRLDRLFQSAEPWTLHDLRRTFATHLAELGVRRPIVSALLNHAGTTVTDIYDRAELRAFKREAVERLGEMIADVTETRVAANV